MQTRESNTTSDKKRRKLLENHMWPQNWWVFNAFFISVVISRTKFSILSIRKWRPELWPLWTFVPYLFLYFWKNFLIDPIWEGTSPPSSNKATKLCQSDYLTVTLYELMSCLQKRSLKLGRTKLRSSWSAEKIVGRKAAMTTRLNQVMSAKLKQVITDC